MKTILNFRKNKVLFSALFLLWVISRPAYSDTRMTITMVDDSEEVLSLQSNNKLQFSDHTLLVIWDDNTLFECPLSIVRKISFVGNVWVDSLDELMKIKETILIYPNPTHDYFDLKFSGTDKVQLRIYDTKGALVLQGNYESGNRINVSALQAGVFVVVVNNQSFKLMKQ